MSGILLVDDEPSIRVALTKALERDGHHVLSASDGRQALEIATRESPELVVTDIRMPVMDGLELLRHLGQFEPPIPVIIMSAYATAEAKRLGAYAVLAKPFKLPELRAAVERALEERNGPAAGAPDPIEVASSESEDVGVSVGKGPDGGDRGC